MGVLWGVVLTLLSLLAWAGQTASWLAPSVAVRFGLMESDEEIEPVYAADIRGEAAWDSLTLWTMPVAGVLLTMGHDAWAYFGLVGGGMYLYFAGRGILTRLAIRRRGFRVGADSSVTTAFALLAVWGVAATVTIAAAVVALRT